MFLVYANMQIEKYSILGGGRQYEYISKVYKGKHENMGTVANVPSIASLATQGKCVEAAGFSAVLFGVFAGVAMTAQTRRVLYLHHGSHLQAGWMGKGSRLAYRN